MAHRAITTADRAEGITSHAPVLALVCLCVAVMSLPGCTVYKMAAAPAKKDLSVLLKLGTPRTRVIAELGPPVRTEKMADSRKDVFTFIQGISTAAKSAATTLAVIDDVGTLGLAEVLFKESGGVRVGQKITVEVYYDASDAVTGNETTLCTQPP